MPLGLQFTMIASYQIFLKGRGRIARCSHLLQHVISVDHFLVVNRFGSLPADLLQHVILRQQQLQLLFTSRKLLQRTPDFSKGFLSQRHRHCTDQSGHFRVGLVLQCG